MFWQNLLTYTLPAGRVLGIPLRIHWLMLITLPFFIMPFARSGGDLGTSAMSLGIGLIVLLVLYGSVLLHELGHAWGMHLVGSKAEEIHLTPIGGVAMGGGSDISPRAELIVVGLGPAVSAALALVGWVATFGLSRSGLDVPLLVSAFATSLFRINLMLLLFNMLLPIFPLDGSKLIRALLSLKYNPQRVTYVIANLGLGLCVVLFLSGILGIHLPYIGSVDGLLFLILILGGMTCWQTLTMIQHQYVYRTQDEWGDRVVFLDSEAMSYAKSRMPGFLKGGAPKRKSARVVEVGRARRVEHNVPNFEKITDQEVLRDMMRAAANAEDFVLAKRIKARIDELKAKAE